MIVVVPCKKVACGACAEPVALGSVGHPRQIAVSSDPGVRHQACTRWDLANSDSVLGLHTYLINRLDLL